MSGAAETWVVIADGTGARVFEERYRLGPLTERADLALVSQEDRHRTAPAGSVVDRGGFGRHTTTTVDPADRAEKRFLTHLAALLDAAALAHSFEHLAIFAPPRALGVLRAALSAATLRRIELCDPHERRGEDAAALQARLRHLRTER
jgi:protein required for attachment to host cells